MEYNSLVTAIPKKWLKQLKQTPALPFVGSLRISKKYKYVANFTCKEFYWQLFEKKLVYPTSLVKRNILLCKL